MPIETFGVDRDIEPDWKKYPFFRARRNQQNRCAIICSSAEEMFIAAQVHFKIGYAICNKGLCCQELGKPRWRVSCVLLQYLSGNSYSLHSWTFGERTYTNLRQIHLGNDDDRGGYQGPACDLTQHDIDISCINEDFQQLWIVPRQGRLHPLPWELIYEQARAVRELCKGSIGATLTEEQMVKFVAGTLDLKALPRNAPAEMKFEEPPKPERVTRYSIALKKIKGG